MKKHEISGLIEEINAVMSVNAANEFTELSTKAKQEILGKFSIFKIKHAEYKSAYDVFELLVDDTFVEKRIVFSSHPASFDAAIKYLQNLVKKSNEEEFTNGK